MKQGYRQTKFNLGLWIAALLIALLGVGASIYKCRNGEPMSWVTFAAELGTLVAAGYFIYEYFRERSNDNNADA